MILHSRIRGAMALAIALIGLLVTTAYCENAAPQPTAPAAYLAKARYITMGKCRMCHSPKYADWSLTVHAKSNKQLPWEDGTTKAAVPEPETVYRYTTGYNAASKTWSEKGTTCEACHGPGSEHFMASKDQRKLTIMNPANLKTAGEKVSVCGRCHGQYTIGDQRFADKYQPGQDLLTTDGFKLDAVQPGKPMQEMNELVQSKHFANGVVCMTCHTSHTSTPVEHSLKKPIVQLCTQCHTDKTIDHARKAPADATCATCHMPNGAHTFTKPAD